MKNKQTFELPNYLSSSPNNSVNFSEKRRKIQKHLEILEEQEFCLNLERFFNIYPNIEEITLTSRREGGFLDIRHSFKGDAQCVAHSDHPNNDVEFEIDDFFSSILNNLEFERLEDCEFKIKKDNIKAAWAEWMGEENYQKWNAQLTEEKLLKIVDSEATQPKQKIKRI